jgi:hypothetical protein
VEVDRDEALVMSDEGRVVVVRLFVTYQAASEIAAPWIVVPCRLTFPHEYPL